MYKYSVYDVRLATANELLLRLRLQVTSDNVIRDITTTDVRSVSHYYPVVFLFQRTSRAQEELLISYDFEELFFATTWGSNRYSPDEFVSACRLLGFERAASWCLAVPYETDKEEDCPL